MLSANDFEDLLDDFFQSSEGKDFLKNSNLNLSGYSEAEMKEIASELVNAIVQAYFGVIKESRKYFNTKGVIINKPYNNKDGTWGLTISFPDKILYRHSLYSDAPKKYGGAKTKPLDPFSRDSKYLGDFTGVGVYDIFGLITQGSSISKAVYGSWWDNSTNDGTRKDVKNPIHIFPNQKREPNSFIADAIKKFQDKYPLIEISFPKKWGGNIDDT